MDFPERPHEILNELLDRLDLSVEERREYQDRLGSALMAQAIELYGVITEADVERAKGEVR